jgi:hypothetical protein
LDLAAGNGDLLVVHPNIGVPERKLS